MVLFLYQKRRKEGAMKVEIRADSVVIDGYVNVPGRDSKVLSSLDGKFIEQVEPGAFQRALDTGKEVRVLLNHNDERELGTNKSDNVKLYEDNIGLRCILETTDQEVREKAQDRKLTGWSFGFKALKQEWQDGEIRKRTLREIDLDEVSILDKAPAYIATSVEVRTDELLEKRAYETTTEYQDLENSEEQTETTYTKDGHIEVKKRIIETMRLRKEVYNEI